MANKNNLNNVDSALDNAAIWDLVKIQIINAYGEGVFRSWFRMILFSHYEHGSIFLITPSRFIRDWIRTNYLDFLLRSWREYDKNIISIELIIEDVVNQPINQNYISSNDEIGENNNIYPAAHIQTQISKLEKNEQEINHDKNRELYFNSRFTFDHFVVDKSNELAYFAAKKIAESERAVVENNPLFLYGGVGLGKTHLMHAVANCKIENLKKKYSSKWFQKAKNKITYLSSEKFLREFLDAIYKKDMNSFKDKFRSTDILMIDDVQFLSGKSVTQEELFHTFNVLMEDGKQLIFSADRTPGDLNGIEERIRSRFSGGLVADIGASSYELRLGILQKKIQYLKIDINHEVLDYLACNIDSNIRELEGALNKITTMANLTGQEITLNNVKNMLCASVKSEPKIITNIDKIQKKVCDFYKISIIDLLSQNRSRQSVLPRQIAMYLSKKLTVFNLAEIARQFGRKDHSTVIHAISKIEEIVKMDVLIKNDVSQIIRNIKI